MSAPDIFDPEGGMQIYKHRQSGVLALAILSAGSVGVAAVLLILNPANPWKTVPSVMVALLVLSMLVFSSLTVEVTSERVSLQLGLGVLRRTFLTKNIRAARIVRNRWFYGFGIRLTPHGWLYNVSGLDAVELEFAGGIRCRIGTDEPQQLLAAIQSACRFDIR
jgi:hypothetical protein